MRTMMILVLVAVFVAAYRGPDEPRRPVAEGNAERGRALIQSYGCGSCHTIPGVLGARALVGPPLWAIADRGYIGGVVPNTQSDMVRWIRNPRAVNPRTVMPNMGVTSYRFPRARLNHGPAQMRSTAGGVPAGTSDERDHGPSRRWRNRGAPRY
jgi:cytochrome c